MTYISSHGIAPLAYHDAKNTSTEHLPRFQECTSSRAPRQRLLASGARGWGPI
jgi:hypothetical protein